MNYLKKNLKWILVLILAITIIVVGFTNISYILVGVIEKYIIHRASMNADWLATDIKQQVAFIGGFVIWGIIFLGNRKYGSFFVANMIYMFIVSNINVWHTNPYYGYRNLWDFSDFVLSAHTGYGALYSTNYPPLAVFLYKVFHLALLDMFTLEEREYMMNYLLFLVIFFTIIFSFMVLVSYFKKDDKYSLNKAYLYALVILISGPSLFTFQRMNNISLAVILIGLFIMQVNSDSGIKKQLGILCLALAANTKYYPAIFGLYLIKRKKFREARIAILEGAFLFLFLLPFRTSYISVYAAEKNMPMFLKKSVVVEGIQGLIGGIEKHTEAIKDYTTGLSVTKMVDSVFVQIGLERSGFWYLFVLIVAIFTCVGLCVWCFFEAKRLDHEIAMLSFMCVLIPNISEWYSILFMVIPLTVFIYNQDNIKKTLLTDIEIILYSVSFVYANFEGLYVGPGYRWYFVLLFIVIVLQILFERKEEI